MKAPKYASKLVHKHGGFVGVCFHQVCLTHKQLWGESFTKETLANSQQQRELLELALNKWGRANLKWVALCDLP